MNILSELLSLSNIDAATFQKTYFRQNPFATPSSAEKLKTLISYSCIPDILNTRYDNCWLVKNGVLSPDYPEGVLSWSQAQQGLLSGYTLLIRNCEKVHAGLAHLTKQFSELLHYPVDSQIYFTPANNMGFNWHYDHQEVFVIQCQGEKEFYLRKHMPFENKGYFPEIRCYLKPGDWLYIPSGYWHKARAITMSGHISLGIHTRCHT